MARRDKFDSVRKKLYLEKLTEGLRPGEAARAVGVTRATVWRHQSINKDFARQCDEAELEACEKVESALYRKAVEGNVVAQQVFLYNRMPDRWRDRRAINQSPVEAFLASLPPELAGALRAVLDGRQPGGDEKVRELPP